MTTTRISDGTPGALFAHSASRDWECDAYLPTGTGVLCPDAKDIARQLIEDNPGTDFNVSNIPAIINPVSMSFGTGKY